MRLNRIVLLAAIASSLMLSGCLHNVGATKQDKVEAAKVCSKVDEPPREPLANVTFFPLPPNTIAPGGVVLVAGLTADGVADILGNTGKLKKREEKWQTRAGAVNTCIEDAAKDKVAVEKK